VSGAESAGDVARLRVAYMLGTFPALTETFVLREIGAIRRRGVEIVICAVRRPGAGWNAVGSATLVADAGCVYARPDSVLRHAAANLACLLRRPRRYFAALRTFLRAAAVLSPGEAVQLLYHFFAGVGFCRDLRRIGVTHLHSHFTSATNMALAASMVGDTPFSFTAHASNDLFVRPILLDEKVARARFVAAESDYAQRYLDSVTGFRFSRKLHRVYNGVEQLDAARMHVTTERPFNDSSPAPGRRRIVSVGSLVAAKGHATLIHVCARLQARGQSFHCRIIGEGPERPTLERLILEQNLENCVELVGALALDGVYAELRQADVFVLLTEIGPSGYRDGLPTVILEAMAAGLPVLATSLSGIPEMVLDGVTGLLVRERDVEGASRALECLLGSAELRRVMGLAGQARVRSLFDLDRSADQLAALLTQRWPAGCTSRTG
jgi:glycosyltransferase involved in cell wall biosynthesis